ncbi:hypothetical protein T440DRAFT_463561 [Plenodomus tracheiphilus IPT5]|uniref:Uncharacterized protein n=1 Tax=Plenodomus tracheiphilus IPT5 TaxID=1408161 RepID=A0A6A7BL72_9PLEO|nr:hypothetical protein T440DRAFT_463561 [Plenodomus tracheiphilus IPT5]
MAVDRPWERPNPNVQRDITRYDTTAEPAGSRQQSRLGNRSNTRQSSYAPSRPDHTTQKPSTPQYHNIIRTNSDNLTQEYPDENRQYVYSLQEWSDRAQRNDPYERIGSIRQDGRVHEQYTPTNEYPEQMYEEEQQQGGEWLGAP